MKAGSILVLLAALVAPSAARAEGNVAVLQGLDKVTARISSIEAPIDSLVRFGTLRIVVKFCRKRPPEDTPESAAFLEVDELRPDEGDARVFTGWMFASSPALSALEDPVYDLRLVDCKKAEKSASSSSE